jgi:hypothetical protein
MHQCYCQRISAGLVPICLSGYRKQWITDEISRYHKQSTEKANMGRMLALWPGYNNDYRGKAVFVCSGVNFGHPNEISTVLDCYSSDSDPRSMVEPPRTNCGCKSQGRRSCFSCIEVYVRLPYLRCCRRVHRSWRLATGRRCPDDGNRHRIRCFFALVVADHDCS